MSEHIPTAQAATARESNAEAARRGLWDALATTECGRPDVIRGFFEAIPPDRDIVDIGCWNGAIAAFGAAHIAGATLEAGATVAPWRSYLGVDVVPEAVTEFRRAHRARPQTRALEGDVRALPLADESADVVLCLFVLQDMRNRAEGLEALRELARIARPGAKLLIGLTVHSTCEEETFYVVKNLRREGIPEKPTHHWRRSDFFGAVRESGFRITRADAFGPTERGFIELYVHAVKDVSPTRSPARNQVVPVRLVPGAPKVFVDYVEDFGRVGDLFAHDFRDPAAFVAAAELAGKRAVPRDELADVLLAQGRLFSCGEAALQNVERLREPGSVAVVTGQQPALFGGPLYNLYKALTAVRLSQVLEQQTGRPHVPVFWIANDDHDLAGVDHVGLLGQTGELERIVWRHAFGRIVQPLAAVRLDGAIEETLGRLARAVGARRRDVLDLLEDCFRAGARLSDAFALLLGRLFERDGLVLIDPSEPALRRLGVPLLEAELSFPSPTTGAARRATAELAGRGYPVQVPLREDRLNLFYGRSERFRLRCGTDGFEISNKSGRVDAVELRASFRAAPEQFSPNVLLRPLYQDALLPTAVYVAGPSEIAYFAQLLPVYSLFEIPMPVIYPRLSATLVNSRMRSLLADSGLAVEDVWRYNDESSSLRDCLFPEGQPQERILGVVHALLEHGLDAVAHIGVQVSFSEFGHQIVSYG